MSPVCKDNSEKAETFGFGSTKKPTFHTFHLTSVCEMLALHHYTERALVSIKNKRLYGFLQCPYIEKSSSQPIRTVHHEG